eukprot:1138891-Pelagomonas_calceolata.AAC.4
MGGTRLGASKQQQQQQRLWASRAQGWISPGCKPPLHGHAAAAAAALPAGIDNTKVWISDAGAMLIFSVSFKFQHVDNAGKQDCLTGDGIRTITSGVLLQKLCQDLIALHAPNCALLHPLAPKKIAPRVKVLHTLQLIGVHQTSSAVPNECITRGGYLRPEIACLLHATCIGVLKWGINKFLKH